MGGLELSVAHVMCLECFRVFVESRVNERQLVTSRDVAGYTVGCPMGCADSFVDPACFEVRKNVLFVTGVCHGGRAACLVKDQQHNGQQEEGYLVFCSSLSCCDCIILLQKTE